MKVKSAQWQDTVLITHLFSAENSEIDLQAQRSRWLFRVSQFVWDKAGRPQEGMVKVMSKPLVTIENWAVVRRGAYAVFEELTPGNILTGRSFGHDRMPDSKSIFTSPIESVDFNRKTVETRNTVYQLGSINPEYQQSAEYRKWAHGLDQYAA